MATITAAATMTISDAALLKLTAWLSPGFPVGAYAYSHGLEWTVRAGDVCDAGGLADWVGAVIGHGSGRSDAILLAHAHRAVAADDMPMLAEVAELAAALVPSAERRLETLAQGAAFRRTAEAAWPAGLDLPEELAYPVAVGAFAAAHGCPLEATALLYLHAFAANLVSAGVRLIPLGQTEGQRIMADLAPCLTKAATEATAAPLDDLGGCTFRIDLASMHHETQYTRLFRS